MNLEPVEEARRNYLFTHNTVKRAEESRLCSFVSRFLLRHCSNYREGTIIAFNTLDRSFAWGSSQTSDADRFKASSSVHSPVLSPLPPLDS